MTIKNLPGEVWRDIPEFPGYKASNMGRIGSCKKQGARGEKWHATEDIQRVLRPITTPGGYKSLGIMGPDGVRQVRAHRLVARAFLGPCPDGQEVCHYDGNPSNNRLENLRYDTRKGNMRDKIRHNRQAKRIERGPVVIPADGRFYSADEVASELGISPQRVRALAQSRAVGTKLGGYMWTFTSRDIDAMRERKPGRPAKESNA